MAVQTHTPQRPRTAARLAAVQALFQIDQNADFADEVIQQFIIYRFNAEQAQLSYEEGCVPSPDVQLFDSVVKKALLHRGRITELLKETLPETWPVERLDPVLRALFMASMGELLENSIPAPVLINEYMDIAHGFFSGDEPKLVNGVLDTVTTKLQADTKGHNAD